MTDPRRRTCCWTAGTPSFGAWSLAVVMLVTGVAVWTTMERFRDPVGEKYVYVLGPGSADFALAFNGARALLLGVDPYRNDVPALEDFWKRDYFRFSGREIRGVYPPTHFLLYLPLALLTDDPRQAARLMFGLNMLALLLLAWVVWRLIIRIADLPPSERGSSLLLFPLLFVGLTCNPGTSLGLERGSSDIVAAVFAWSSVLCWVDRRVFAAMFLMTPAALLKGYAAWCWLGLALLGAGGSTWRATAAGGAVGLAVFLLPVLQHVGAGWEVRRELWAVTDRLDWIFLWWNHGFRNVYRQMAPALERGGWIATTAYTAALAALCWLKMQRATRTARSPESALWVVAFTTAAMAVMLGWNPQSLLYNQILALPGMLVLMILPGALVRAGGLPERSIPILGAVNLAIAFGLIKAKWMDLDAVPLAGLAMVLFLLTLGAVIIGGWCTRRARLVS